MNIKWIDKFDGIYVHQNSIFEWLIEHDKNKSSYDVLLADLNRMVTEIQTAGVLRTQRR